MLTLRVNTQTGGFMVPIPHASIHGTCYDANSVLPHLFLLPQAPQDLRLVAMELLYKRALQFLQF